MNSQHPLPSFWRRPESSDFNDFLDAGLRRHDRHKVNGTAVAAFYKTPRSAAISNAAATMPESLLRTRAAR